MPLTAQSRFFLFYCFVGAMLSLFTAELNAIELESFSELRIQADQLSIDKEKQSSRYIGNVQIEYEDKRLLAEQVDIFFQDDILNKIIAIGRDTPVSIRIKNALGHVHGSAGKMIYSLRENRLELRNNALLQKNDDLFSGEIINIDLNSHKITAAKSPSSGEQVKMIIKAPSQQK